MQAASNVSADIKQEEKIEKREQHVKIKKGKS